MKTIQEPERETKEKTIGVMMTATLYQKLKDVADKERRSISQMGALLIEQALAKKST